MLLSRFTLVGVCYDEVQHPDKIRNGCTGFDCVNLFFVLSPVGYFGTCKCSSWTLVLVISFQIDNMRLNLTSRLCHTSLYIFKIYLIVNLEV